MILTLSAGWDLPPASLAHLGTQGRVLLPSSCLPSSSSSDRPGSSPAASAPHPCYCFCSDWALSDLLPLPVPCSCSVQILQPWRGPGPPDKPGFILISLVAPHYSFLNRFKKKKKNVVICIKKRSLIWYLLLPLDCELCEDQTMSASSALHTCLAELPMSTFCIGAWIRWPTPAESPSPVEFPIHHCCKYGPKLCPKIYIFPKLEAQN